MCTAISFSSEKHYFGRNLDLEYCYDEAVTITPRRFPLSFRNESTRSEHYAIIGTAIVRDGYPLYYDAVNEYGLAIAGLNFPGNAFYEGHALHTVAPFELIPWVLGQCRNVNDAVSLLQNTALSPTSFSDALAVTDLHWMLSDCNKSITVEPLPSGLMIRDNPVRVLTNNPPFDFHLHNLKNYLKLSEKEPENTIAPGLILQPYSRGMGAIGLPGDLSSASRFVRAVFHLHHSVYPQDEIPAVNQFFRILNTVYQTEGAVQVGTQLEKTVYTCCYNTDQGIYYYTTYENPQITAVHLHREDLDGKFLIQYPLDKEHVVRQTN